MSMSVILQGQGSKVPSRAGFKQGRDLVGASSNVGVHLMSIWIQAAGYKRSDSVHVQLETSTLSLCSFVFSPLVLHPSKVPLGLPVLPFCSFFAIVFQQLFFLFL